MTRARARPANSASRSASAVALTARRPTRASIRRSPRTGSRSSSRSTRPVPVDRQDPRGARGCCGRRIGPGCSRPRPAAADVRVELGRRGLTRRDPWVNILRATIAGFAGAVAGANEIVLLPYTDRLGVPDAEARRLSRNTTQLILRATNARCIASPIPRRLRHHRNALTMGLAEAAWAVMAEIEALGGMGAGARSRAGRRRSRPRARPSVRRRSRGARSASPACPNSRTSTRSCRRRRAARRARGARCRRGPMTAPTRR